MSNVKFLDTPLAKSDRRKTHAELRQQVAAQGKSIKRLRGTISLMTFIMAGSGLVNIALIGIVIYIRS